MSTIKLGKININRSSRSYDTYVASICRSESGFTRPFLAVSTLEVETFFGSFPFKDMLCKFIEDGIPVLLLPIITPMSEYNRCTLRLNDISSEAGGAFPYTYPKFGREGSSLDEGEWDVPTSLVADGKEHYMHILDFGRVDDDVLSDRNSFFITRIGDERLMVYPCIDGVPHPNTDVPNSVYEQSIGIKADDGGRFIGKKAFLSKIKAYVNGGHVDSYIGLLYKADTEPKEGASCMDIFDIIIDKVGRFVSEESIVVSEQDYENSYAGLYPSFDSYKSGKWEAERKKFREWLARQDFLLCDTMLAVSCCTAILDDMAMDSGTVATIDTNTDEGTSFLSEFSSRLTAVPDDGRGYQWRSASLPYFSLCVKSRKPNALIDYSNMKGFSTFVLEGPSLDIISDYTEPCKVAEFSAKAKGSRGCSIKVKIEPAYKRPRCYDLTLSSGEYKEHAYVTTGEETEDYIHLNRLGDESNLVDAKLFNYVLPNGRRICTDDFDRYVGDGVPYDETRIIDLELPIGEWTLGRCAKEVFDYECARDTLGILEDSEYYPDFLLVNELNFGNNRRKVTEHRDGEDDVDITVGADNNHDYLKHLLEYSVSKHTQVLVRVEEQIYNPSPPTIPTPLVTGQSRMLYFKGCYTHNGVVFPCFYPYATNFLRGDFIKRLPYGVMYEGDGGTSDYDVSDMGVNTLSYNNYYYNYMTVREPHGTYDPNAIIRFIASLISRVFYRGKYDFIGIEPGDLPSTIGAKVAKAKALLPILGDVAYSYTINIDAVAIILCFTVPSIVNKEYRLNITLTTT